MGREERREEEADLGHGMAPCAPSCFSCQVPYMSPPHPTSYTQAKGPYRAGEGEAEALSELTLVTEGPLPGSPLETLNNAVLH